MTKEELLKENERLKTELIKAADWLSESIAQTKRLEEEKKEADTLFMSAYDDLTQVKGLYEDLSRSHEETLNEANRAVNAGDMALLKYKVDVAKFTKAPQIRQQQSKKFWDTQRVRYNEKLASNPNMKASTAKNIIGNEIKNETGKRPNNSTLHRQLVTSQK